LVRLQARCGGKTAKENPLNSLAEEKATPDVLVHNEGTVFLFNPLSARAKKWIEKNVETESYQWFGTTLVVEYKFAWGLAEGMKDAGLVLQ
jgi:hypothetical protein